MRKILFTTCLLLISLGASAQFEKNSWVINPTITGMEYSYSDANKNHLGLSAQGGAFVMDDVALLLKLGGDWTKTINTYSVGVGGRYYFSNTGVYAGSELYLTRWAYNNDKEQQGHKEEYGLTIDGGYAFFLNRTITIEPAVYYDLSFKDSNLSKFGLKLGLGVYF
ncbi:MAG: hypothetical protein EZS26_002543 [Candidatus Ordinivivax streblomastigis]|uniref:Outer membrane protein beta-barrel domain-containing protein n=1 Tax=Candidatus Ordinivivax streblomastigis TaxID=2540710 RepID=A0A5M8NYW7_9BACT|nr:MAG: hypothetical protein EZS26_002543 [Candidatus Ordinivivax streblomastigis]